MIFLSSNISASGSIHSLASTPGWTPINSPWTVVLFITLIMGALYTIASFANHHPRSLFQKNFWQGPAATIVTITLFSLSFICFALAFTVWTPAALAAPSPLLFYSLIMYFLLLIVAIPFTIIIRGATTQRDRSRAITISFLGTTIALILIIFLL
ncbi:hypothetical protein FLK61_24005 [Paenalkalicoccus suaedae]|uniref:Uncharacterized protein n=1 Tax=Paenalkalicoccus suaedae TaxID=2592382 RepID=A0A859FBD7_9BACI|nr:hypothetical protein [Paenalkalicoccus suaedae]QKS69854.1 hypothetical protein FLK61_24005 [Paenalkalicoccus suaedae]